jgi:ligand-binding sensor domain-containing protein/signal transduction histidine kinase
MAEDAGISTPGERGARCSPRNMLRTLVNLVMLGGIRAILSFLVCLAVIACFTASVSAQVAVPFHNFTVRAWTTANGLPRESVQALAQTADRYLWVGTIGGLVRFDGSSFIMFNRHNTSAIRENSVFSLLAAKDGSLWVGTEGGGALHYNNGNFESFAERQGLTNGFVRSILEDARGTIWLGTDNGVFRLEGGQFKRIDGTPNFPSITVHVIIQASDGALWIAGSRLVRWKDSIAEDWPLGRESTQTAIKSVLEAHNGYLYLGGVNGLYQIRPYGNQVRRAPKKIAGVDDTIRSLHEAANGDIWIATTKHGVLLDHDGRIQPVKLIQNSSSNTVFCIFEDKNHSLWFGTQTGLVRLRQTAITTVLLPGTGDSDFGNVYEDTQGKMWFAYSHLYQFANYKLERLKFPSLGAIVIHNIFRDMAGAIWIGTGGQGVFRLWHGTVEHYTIANGLVNNFIRVMIQDDADGVWIGTDGGLSHWHKTASNGLAINTVLGYTDVRDILAEGNGDLWVAAAEGVKFLHNGAFEENTVTHQLKQEKVLTLCKDSTGGLWFGTEDNGIFRWKSGRLAHYTRGDGLPTDQVYKVLEDKNHRIWFSSSNGISTANLTAFENAGNQPGRHLPVTFYATAEDMQCTQVYGSIQPAGFVARDGHVWFPGIEGPIRMPLTTETPTDTAPVIIDGVVVNGRGIDAASRITLRPDTSRVEFHFTTVLPQSPERIRYRYRLFGFDKGWTDASAERAADYTNLPPGSYEFHVIAYDLNNPSGITEAKAVLIQKPYFYHTSWFLGICILVLVSIAFAGNRIYVRNLRARYAGILQERARVARELHDTLIQGCTTVSALLDASSLTQGASSEKLLMHAREQIRATTENTRRAVWNLRNDERSHDHFDRAIDSLVGKFRKDFELPVRMNVSGKPFDISEECEHELMMVMREALYNSARHSHASDVSVNIRYDTAALVLELADNGIGFDVTEVMRNGDLHYGLKGLKERIARMKGNVILQSVIGKGTSITVSLPRGKASKRGRSKNVEPT